MINNSHFLFNYFHRPRTNGGVELEFDLKKFLILAGILICALFIFAAYQVGVCRGENDATKKVRAEAVRAGVAEYRVEMRIEEPVLVFRYRPVPEIIDGYVVERSKERDTEKSVPKLPEPGSETNPVGDKK